VLRLDDTVKREGKKEQDSIYIHRIIRKTLMLRRHLPPPDMQNSL